MSAARPGRLSIKVKMLIFVLLLTGATFSVLFLLISSTYRQGNIAKGYEDNRRALKSIDQELLEKELEISDYMLDVYVDETVSESLAQLSGEPLGYDRRSRLVSRVVTRLYEHLRRTKALSLVDIFLPDKPDISIRAVYATSNDIANREEFFRDYYRQVVEQAGEILVYPSRALSRQLIFARYLPLPGDGEKGFCIAVMMESSYVMRVLTRNIYEDTSLALIYAPDGTIASASRFGLAGQSASQLGMQWQEGLDGAICQGPDNDWLYVTRYIKSLDMYAAVLTDMRAVDLTTSVVVKSLAMMFVGAFLAAALLAFFVSRWIGRPLSDLVRQLSGIGKPGGGSRLEVRGGDEISAIAVHFNQVLERQEKLLRDNYAFKVQEKNARIALLQVQINPHFVFNTLDVINWFIYAGKNDQASQVLISLGEMLRYSTYRYRSFVPLADELTQVRNYLFIQQARYDGAFEAVVEAPQELMGTAIPCLTIQPLVENAVKYGVSAMKKGGLVEVRAQKEGESFVRVTVRDNGRGMTDSEIEKALGGKRQVDQTSIGIANVAERIRLLFGEDCALSIASQTGAYTLVTLRLPLGGEAACG